MTSYKLRVTSEKIIRTSIVFAIVLLTLVVCPDFSQCGEFQESFYVNRAKASVHYFFSCFEQNPRDVDSIINLLVDKNLELIYPWGQINSKDEACKWISGISNEFKDAHHIKQIKVSKISDKKYKLIADVLWQNQGPEIEQFDSAHRIYEFELIDTGGEFVKIKKVHSKAVKE